MWDGVACFDQKLSESTCTPPCLVRFFVPLFVPVGVSADSTHHATALRLGAPAELTPSNPTNLPRDKRLLKGNQFPLMAVLVGCPHREMSLKQSSRASKSTMLAAT